MCFDLSDRKGMQWSISIGSCSNMRIVRESWQDFSGLICLEELHLIYRIVRILVFLSLTWVTSHPILVFRRPKVQNLQSSCSYFFVQGALSGQARSPQFSHFKMATGKLKKRSYPNLLILQALCKLYCLNNYTEQSYIYINLNARMPYSFSS